ncbi:MAG: DUF393 domain-containing protein [Polyangiaceae bacterium]|nr:DUF393 domain-containing protein [Polyangiaceae bacterium]
MKLAASLPKEHQTLLSEGPLLLYDGDCGVCAASVKWILQRETANESLRFASLQSRLGEELREHLPLPENLDSILWLEQMSTAETASSNIAISFYSTAVIRALRYLGGIYQIGAFCLWSVPRPIRDFAYRTFAAHRHQFLEASCFVPSKDQRERFLEG